MDWIKPEVMEVEIDNQKLYFSSYQQYDKIVKEVDELKGKVNYFGLKKCWKCNGTGSVHWQRDNGICYECHGRGKLVTKLKVSKNRETIQRRIDKKEAQEKFKEENSYQIELAKTKERYGEIFYLILNGEKNTYETREELKQKGCRFEGYIKTWWGRTKDLEGYKLIEVKTDEVLNSYGRVDMGKLAGILNKELFKIED